MNCMMLLKCSNWFSQIRVLPSFLWSRDCHHMLWNMVSSYNYIYYISWIMKEGFEQGTVIPWWKKSVHSGEPYSLVLQLHRKGELVPSGPCGSVSSTGNEGKMLFSCFISKYLRACRNWGQGNLPGTHSVNAAHAACLRDIAHR